MVSKLKNKYSFIMYPSAVFIFCAAAMGIIFLVNSLFGDKSILITDMSQQYIDYFAGYRDILTNGESFFYTWKTGMGMNFLGLFAYYLSSPFSLIILLFPKSMIVEAVAVMSIIKTGLCGVSFSILLRNLRGNWCSYDAAFAVIYALTSYNIIYFFNIMWLDGVILLPIILVGVEILLDKGKILPFTISLCVVFIANFYISFMVGVFVFMWLILSLIRRGKELKYSFKKILSFFGCVVLAAGMAAVLLLPAYFSLTAAYGDSSSFEFTGKIHTGFIELLSKMLPLTFDTVTSMGTPLIYCSVFTLLLIPIYFLSKKITKREKISSAVVLLIFIISFIFWDISNIWHVFREPTWFNYRYSFTYCCFAVLLAWRGFSVIESVKVRSVAISLTVTAVLSAIIFYSTDKTPKMMVYLIGLFIALAIIILLKRRNFKLMPIFLIFVVFAELTLNGMYSIDYLSKDLGGFDSRECYAEAADFNNEMVDVINSIENDNEEFFRTENLKMRWSNDNIANNYNGIAHYSSLSNRSAFGFMGKLGMLCVTNDRYLRYFGTTNVIDDLFGVKYTASIEQRRSGYTKISDLNGGVLLKNENALPLAYAVSDDILNYSPVYDSPFENQNQLLSALSGENTEVFSEITEYEFTVNDLSANDSTYTVSGDNPEFVFKFKNPKSQQVYLRFDSSFNEHNPILVNGKTIGRDVDDYLRASIPIGYFEKGEEIEIRIQILYGESEQVDGIYLVNLDEDILDSVIEKLAVTSSEFSASGANVFGHITANEDCTVFTTIPFDSGWSVFVDGKETEITPIEGAFIAFPITQGEHKIEMKFVPDGFNLGLIITIVSIIIFAAAVWLIDFSGRRRLLCRGSL